MEQTTNTMAKAAATFDGNRYDAGRWRVLIAVPPGGLDAQFATMRGWLDALCGPGGWSAAPAGLSGVINDAIAFYFADRAVARAFVARFACGYRAVP